MAIKQEIKILGIDDCPFDPVKDKEVMVIGVVARVSGRVDGILSFTVKVNGKDATNKIISILKHSKFRDIRLLMSIGIFLGGFNPIDIDRIWKETGIPCIVVIRKKPDLEKIEKSLQRFGEDYKLFVMDVIERAGPVYEMENRGSKIYYQCAGISRKDAELIIKRTSIYAAVPEPVRLAHLIATGVALGESRGKA